MITDVGKFKAINSNYQVQCPNFKFKGTTNYANSNHKVQCPNLKFKGTTNYANYTNHLAISIRVISAIRSCSKFKS